MASSHVRLIEVATAAGVSIASASKALNGRAGISAATRRRVQEVAAALDFHPNMLAQTLYSGRSGTVGLLTNDLEGRFVLPVLGGAENAFDVGQLSVLLCDAREDEVRERHHLQVLLSRRIDGLIVVGSRTDPRPSLGRDLGVPIVYAYAPSEDPDDISLVTDNVGGSRLAVDHLVSTGRRRIAVISGDPAFAAAHDRAIGTRAALTAHGLTAVNRDDLFGGWAESWGVTAMIGLLDAHDDIDAVLCANDQIARGAISVLRERGIDVPGRIAVMGYDNWEVIATGSRVPISSIDPNLELLGRLAAERLAAEIDEPAAPGIQLVPGRVVARESTGARA